MKKLTELTYSEMVSVNGGGLIEDIGCLCRRVECAVLEAYDEVKRWFE